MTSDLLSRTDRLTGDADSYATPRHIYMTFLRHGGLRFETLEGIVGDGSQGPPQTEHQKWFADIHQCILPFRDLSAIEHDMLRCASSTLHDSGAPSSSLVATSTAINREIQLESRLIHEFNAFVHSARHEIFADGEDSVFADRIHGSIERYGETAAVAWERILSNSANMFETGEELLRQLGHSRHAPSHGVRLRILLDSLNHPDARIRDAAGLGLSFLDDVVAVSGLREAVNREEKCWVRRNLQMVVEQMGSNEWQSI